MDHIQNTGCAAETGEHYMDFDWKEFVEQLFNQSPKEPFTFHIEMLTEINEKQLSTLLGNMLITGVKKLYNKDIAQLLPDEIENMQKYFKSIGFEVEYLIKTQTQYISELQKTVPVNYFQIDFKNCSQLLNNHNKPEKIL